MHKEQNPPASVYFDPLNAKELAGILRTFWNENRGGPNPELEEKAREELPARTRDFGLAYQNVVLEVCNQ